MSSHAQDRAAVCTFTFTDGRRCRTPRSLNHPHFCFFHARKEAQARAADELGNDLSYFFSGDYLSACDLSTALGRTILAVVKGHLKPRAATAVGYLSQTLLQTIPLAQREYIETFGEKSWTESVQISVSDNYEHRYPPRPSQQAPGQNQTPAPPANPPQLQDAAPTEDAEAITTNES